MNSKIGNKIVNNYLSTKPEKETKIRVLQMWIARQRNRITNDLK